MRIIAAILTLFLALGLSSQNIPIGQWRTHLTYSSGTRLMEVKDKIYCATPEGLFSVDKGDRQVRPLSRVQGFSDVFIRNIYYAAGSDMLFIAYRNAGLDILHGNEIIPVTAFEKAAASGAANINSFFAYQNSCFVCTTFGIYEYLMDRQEIGRAYNKFESFNSVTVLGTDIYASSEKGVIHDNLNQAFLFGSPLSISADSCGSIVTFNKEVWGIFKGNLLKHYSSGQWVNFPSVNGQLRSLEVNYGKLIITTDQEIVVVSDNLSSSAVNTGTLQPNDALLDAEGIVWFGRGYSGCIPVVNGKIADFGYRPNNPGILRSSYLFGTKGEVWTGTGGINLQGAPLYNPNGAARFNESGWHNYLIDLPFSIKDPWRVMKDTIQEHVWISTLDTGLVELNADGSLKQIYNYANTGGALDKPSYENNPHKNYSLVSGVSFDPSGNLWASIYRANLRQLALRTSQGAWKGFNVYSDREPMNVLADDYGNVWLYFRGGGMLVYNPGDKLLDEKDDKTLFLSEGTGKGALPNRGVNAMAKDKSGQIWVGTNDGVAVFADPSQAFSGRAFDAQKIWVKNGSESGYLLMGQSVTSIAVDGANRKWLGTRNGVWLTNPDGDKILAHYTSENAPFTSNIINSIAIDGKTGEVFFATEEGIISFRGTATEGGDKHENVYAWPNPVKPGYKGPIAISGLVRNAHVKITDITGNLVWETIADGGQAIWYGKNFSGQEAHSGVYLVFSTNEDGTETYATKILVVRGNE